MTSLSVQNQSKIHWYWQSSRKEESVSKAFGERAIFDESVVVEVESVVKFESS